MLPTSRTDRTNPPPKRACAQRLPSGRAVRIMCAMILRLDPRRPFVWRTPSSIQIGIDPAVVVLEDVDDGDARVLAALGTGVTRQGLSVIGGGAGVDEARLDELIEALRPALEPARPSVGAPSESATVCVIGSVPAAAHIAGLLAAAGHRVLTATATDDLDAEPISAAVLVSHHVIDPREHLRWLNRDIPHLAVVFGELAATVGPLVRPGSTPCLACVEQQRTDADPAWPAIGTQLWGTPAAADTTLLATEAALETVRMLAERPEDQVRIDAERGARIRRRWDYSARCGCRGLELSLAAPPRAS